MTTQPCHSSQPFSLGQPDRFCLGLALFYRLAWWDLLGIASLAVLEELLWGSPGACRRGPAVVAARPGQCPDSLLGFGNNLLSYNCVSWECTPRWVEGFFLSQGALLALAHLFPDAALFSLKQIKTSRAVAHGNVGQWHLPAPCPPCSLLAARAQGDGAGPGAGCTPSCCPTFRLLCRGGRRDGLVTAPLKPGLQVGQRAQPPRTRRPVLLHPVLFISLQNSISKRSVTVLCAAAQKARSPWTGKISVCFLCCAIKW